METVWFLPGEQHLSCRTGLHRQGRAHRDGIAQAHGAVSGRDADALVALTAEELSAFMRVVAQRAQHRASGSQQAVFTRCRGQLHEARAEHETALHVPRDEPVMLQGHGETVSCRARQSGCCDELGQGRWAGLKCRKYGRGLVENADSTRVVHVLILQSQSARRKSSGVKKRPQYGAGPKIGRGKTASLGGYVGKTLAEKVWQQHVVRSAQGEPDLLYIDLHLLHEVTSPQAFDGLRLAGRKVRRPDLTIATEDHNVPTTPGPITDPVSKTQVETLRRNCDEFGIRLFPMGDAQQGIVHIIGPQLGLTQPGSTIVCGDSHTSTHGAFGALAFGIGTSEVEHVLATQTLPLRPFKTMAINIDGRLPEGVSSKDVILAVIAKIGTGGGQGYVLEYRGSAVEAMSMEARMTMCNMSIEAGARAGMVAPDETTFEYLKGRPHAPQGAEWDAAVEAWKQLRTDDDATFDAEVHLDATQLAPFVTWGTNPGQGLPLSASVPDPARMGDESEQAAAQAALDYMGLTPGTPLREVSIDTVFVGSCTNGRLEDLRTVADVLRGRQVAEGVEMLVVPGSAQVRQAAEAEGLHEVVTAAGAQWRLPGCSMCLGMNPDQLKPGQRSASTSNRNFEGRQGKGGRTHLVSPAVAAASAVAGRLASPADLPTLSSTVTEA